jgi:hypothetical protein
VARRGKSREKEKRVGDEQKSTSVQKSSVKKHFAFAIRSAELAKKKKRSGVAPPPGSAIVTVR